jgi:hypothetical protein
MGRLRESGATVKAHANSWCPAEPKSPWSLRKMVPPLGQRGDAEPHTGDERGERPWLQEPGAGEAHNFRSLVESRCLPAEHLTAIATKPIADPYS